MFLFTCFLFTSVARRQSVVVLDKNRLYDERPLHFLSFSDLVFYYGDRTNWWGDLDASQTRKLYHELLPYYYPSYLNDNDPISLARKVFDARRSARSYARRRSYFYVRWMSILMDGIRNMVRHKKWKTVFDDTWNKYEHYVKEDEYQIALRILNGSCHTNPWADRFCGRIEKLSVGIDR